MSRPAPGAATGNAVPELVRDGATTVAATPAEPAVAVTHGRVGGGWAGSAASSPGGARSHAEDADRERGSRGSASAAGEKAMWKSVAMPIEHGGWGLSAEPGLLGLLVAPSWAGLAIAVAAVVAFLVRTPLKLAVIDRRRGRSLPRTRLAVWIASVELALLAGLGAVALALAGPGWLVPIAVAAPLVAVELWFDVRSRGRRLVPELAGSIGICAVAAAVAVAGGAPAPLATALWLILAARAVATVAFARVQVMRFRMTRTASARSSNPSARRPGSRLSASENAGGSSAGAGASTGPSLLTRPAVSTEPAASTGPAASSGSVVSTGPAASTGPSVSTASSDWSQVVGVAIAVAAVAVAPEVIAGALLIVVVAAGEVLMVRQPPIQPKVLGFTQLGIGLGLVAVTALSVGLL